MDFAVLLLVATFVISFIALLVFIRSMTQGLFGQDSEAAKMIFAEGLKTPIFGSAKCLPLLRNSATNWMNA